MNEQPFRIEKDSMGEVSVPASALFGAQTQRAVENFTISRESLPWNFLAAMLLIKDAAAKTNAELGLLTAVQAKAIGHAVEHLLDNKPLDQFPVPVLQTGSGTSTNMNVNEVIAGLAKQAGVELSANDHVNMGQSSNDVIPTALHVSAAVAARQSLIPAIQYLAENIRKVASANSGVIKTGRTHLMDALPIPFSAELEGWAMQLDEAVERVESGLLRLYRLPLGGTAVGSGVNCPEGFPERAIALLAETTALPFLPAPSTYKGLSSLDTVVEFSGHLKAAATALMKIANDLRWMNSGPLAGLGEITLPALQPGSSIMPAKVNPVIPEAVCMAMAQVFGCDTTITVAASSGNFQLNTMLPIAAAKILEAIGLVAASARTLGEKAIKDMKINAEQCGRSLSLNPILVTSLNPITGYLKAAEIGKIAIREKRPVIDVAEEHTGLPREQLEKLLDPARLASGGK